MQLAHARGQRMEVYYFKGHLAKAEEAMKKATGRRGIGLQMSETSPYGAKWTGEVEWEDVPKHNLLRDKVMKKHPKDSAGWPKKLTEEEENAHLQELEENDTRAGIEI